MKKLLALFAMLIATVASAQNITAVVSLPPGSSIDTYARLVMKRYDEVYGTVTTFVNRPGGDGAVAVNYFNELPADTTKLLFPSTGHILALTPAEFDKLSPLVEMVRQPFALIVRKDFPANNWKEFVEYARANPGKVNTGTGARAVMFPLLETFERKNNYRTNWIAYAGTARPDMDVAGGTLDSLWNPVGITLYNSGLADKVKVITVSSNDLLPGVDPALIKGREHGAMHIHQAIFVSANMDSAAKQKLNDQFTAIIKSSWGQEALAKTGTSPVGGPVAGFATFLKDSHTRWQAMKNQYQQ